MLARSIRRTSILLTLLAVLALTVGAVISAQPVSSDGRAQITTSASETDFRSSPVMFIENAGQWPEAARFQVWGGTTGTMWLAEDAIWVTVIEQSPVPDSQVAGSRDRDPATFNLQPSELRPTRAVNIKLSFVGANPYPRIEPFDRLDTKVSYFIGNQPDKWRPDVPVWGGVRYVDLYPGVDLEIASENGQMVQRLAAQPGADASAVRLRVEGVDSIAVNDTMLRLSTVAGEVTWPLLVEEASGDTTVRPLGKQAFAIATPFALAVVSLKSPVANPQSVTDNPAELLYSTYLGGSNGDHASSVTVDGAGCAYVTGHTDSGDFPTTPGVLDTSFNGGICGSAGYSYPCHDIFVVKLNPTGRSLVYATFLGGSGIDDGEAIAVDRAGSAYVTGQTNSINFPTTAGAFDRIYGGGIYNPPDAFMVKLDQAGSGLAHATFLGGSDRDYGWGIAVAESGDTYVTGATYSNDFPTTPGAFDTSYNPNGIHAPCDAFVVKLNQAGSGLSYATFLGGSDSDDGLGITVAGSGHAYVTGVTTSNDFPTTLGAFDRSYNGGSFLYDTDAFVVKLNPDGSRLTYATFLGGSGNELSFGIAVDEVGSAYVTGYTGSINFPTTAGAFDRSYHGDAGDDGGGDAFVVKLDAAGGGLHYSTFLGGSNLDHGYAIAVDRAGSASVTGETYSIDFPATFGAFDTSHNGGYEDAFVVKLNPTGSELAYATFLGGSNSDQGHAIAVDAVGSAYVAGDFNSSNFPTTPDAFDRSYNGGFNDAFVVKLAMGVTPTYTISGRVTDASGHAIPGVTVSAGSSSSTTTDANGNYTFTGLPAGTYNISPSRYLYAFSPPSRTVTVPPNATGQDFVQTPIVDLSVNRIEVAQVFVEQDDPISGTPIPLIAQKDTLVRVYVGVNGADSVGGVSARLHIRQPNGTETVDSRPINVWPVQAKQTPDPFSLQDTINFRPATKLLQGNVTFWADVDPENRIPETNESNNTGGQVSKTFQAGKPVRIGITQIGYRGFPWGPYAYADWNTIARADAMLRQVYPVAADDVQYYYQPGDPARVQCLWGNQDACWAEFHNQLKAFWRRVDDEGKWVGGTRPHALVGWVPGTARDAGGTCGQANRLSPREVVIADYCDKYMGKPPALTPEPIARVLAHEVGHLLNTKPELQHAKNQPNKDDPQCSAVPDKLDPRYPTPPSYPMGSTFAHGLDMSNANPKVLEPKKTPLATYDLMSYCSPAWISPYNYFKLNTGFTDTAAAQASDAEPDALVRKLLVSGLVFTPTFQVELNPFYVLNTTSAADADSGTDYCLEARNASGVVLNKRCFDLAFVDRETYAPASVDGFALAVPYPNGMTQIVLTRKGTPIASRVVSPHAPTVRLLSPNGGETWAGTGTHTVTWTASDQDGDTLHFALAYSTDGGASWIPAGSDLTGTQHALDVSLLPGGTSVLLRISATDGVNTTDDVSDAPFTVGRKAPMAFILSPEDGAHFFPGAAIWLEGRAFDLEDGTLGDAALRWSSDRDGVLGTGKLLIAALSPGEHTITLTATDSDGARATVTIRLSAGDRVFLPVVLR